MVYITIYTGMPSTVMLLSFDPTNTNQYSELYCHIRFHTPYQTCTVPEHVFIAMGLECHFKLIFYFYHCPLSNELQPTNDGHLL